MSQNAESRHAGRAEHHARFPKSRVDALTDGVFAFAMTLLVLDIRLPDDLKIDDAAALTAHLLSLGHETLTYLISFLVLGAFWRGTIETRRSEEQVGHNVVGVSLWLLFLVTVVPFSSGLVSRYGAFSPAILVYAANMGALALLVVALRYLDVAPERRSLVAAFGDRLPLFLASALLSALLGLVAPHAAMYAYLLNILSRLPFWPKTPAEADRS
ncbi:TMEM175 family protein [Xanthobacter pseudotagetidis]|uniref:TMEM175 family protein n=1 Tax=Xanthobacter pseudotagetidis TaxID=3119911 RepID=UPI00372AA5EC